MTDKARAARTNRFSSTFAKSIADCLKTLNEKVVFAESCTAGNVVATLAEVPGISKYLCGSLVSYRPQCKQKWLGVDCRTIQKHTTESRQVAKAMAVGALKKTPEATWAVSIVGHVGPGSPPKKDGVVHVCVARRGSNGNIKVKEVIEHKLPVQGRVIRQKLASEAALTHLAKRLMKRLEKKGKSIEPKKKKQKQEA